MVNTLWNRNHWHTKTDKQQGSYNTDYNPNAVYINVKGMFWLCVIELIIKILRMFGLNPPTFLFILVAL